MSQPTLRNIRDAVRSGARSAVDVCQEALARIEAHNPTLNALNTVTRDQALAQAAAVDARPDRASLPLAGVPVAIKDNLCTTGVRTTASSKILEHFVPPYTATAEPPLDPPGMREVSHGLRTTPNAEFSFDDPIANSSQLALPTITAPAASSFCTAVAV